MKVLIISFMSVLCLSIGLGIINLWGESTQFQKFDHPFFADTRPYTAVRVVNKTEIDSALPLKPDLIFWIDVRVTKDHFFLALPNQSLTKTQHQNLSELRPSFPDAELVSDLLSHAPKNRFILHFTDNAYDIHSNIIKLLTDLNAHDRALISSDTDVIIRSIRDEKPQWIFGTSQAELVRLMSFESLWILKAATFRADALIAPITIKSRPAFTSEGIAETKRRKKRSLIGPLETSEDVQSAKAFGPDGLIFGSIELLKQN